MYTESLEKFCAVHLECAAELRRRMDQLYERYMESKEREEHKDVHTKVGNALNTRTAKLLYFETICQFNAPDSKDPKNTDMEEEDEFNLNVKKK